MVQYSMKLNGHHNVILLMLEYDVNLIITNFSTSGIGNSSGFLSSPGLMFSIANETGADRRMQQIAQNIGSNFVSYVIVIYQKKSEICILLIL